MMEGRTGIRNLGRGFFSDLVLEFVLDYIHDPRDRDAVSLVCRRWYEVDSRTRKHVTIALCYSTSPRHLRKRFVHLESLKLKGKPRAAMFNLIPENWGGYVTPWVQEIAQSFSCLKSLHFRRMIVEDSDLELLAEARGENLQALKLDKCCGFSTDGLLRIAQLCRRLTTLYLEESLIDEKNGEWLHELALNNTVLETLDFYMTELVQINYQDLELMARNCRSLVSLKICDTEISDLAGFFEAATALREFRGGSYMQPVEMYNAIKFPPSICCLGLSLMRSCELHIVFPFAAQLKRLDLLYAFLNTEDHCMLIQRCPNLEVLEVRDVIGDRGVEILGQCCKKLRRLRIERGDDEQEDVVSHRGLTALAQGCSELEYLAVYVADITNTALETFGTYSKNLCDFRIVLLDLQEQVSDLPLDDGVRALLIGCPRLRRFALYLRPGGVTDVGLGYIGLYSRNVRWMLLGPAGDSDEGLLELSRGCPRLQKLEMRGCCFSERALAIAVKQLTSLRYIWVQGYKASESGCDILAMARPFWNIEVIPPRHDVVGEGVVVEQPAHILAYYSLSGNRTDCPDYVFPLLTPPLPVS